MKAISLKKNKAPIDDDVKEEMKNLFDINESLLVFDIRDVAGVNSEYDHFVKEILLRTVKNIKQFSQVLNKDNIDKRKNDSNLILQIVQSWESLPILNKVYKQIIKLVQNGVEINNQNTNESRNEHEISNLFREDEIEDNEHNELNYNSSNSHKQSSKNLKG